MSDKVTNWELRLREFVLSPLKKIADIATGTQRKINDVSGSLDKIGKASNVMGREFKRNLEQLNSLLTGLEKKQAQAFTTKHMQAYQRMIDKTRSEIKRLESAMTPAPAQLNFWQRLRGGLRDSANEIPFLSNGMRLLGNPMVLAGAAAFTLGSGLMKATDLAMDFDKGMAKINATAQLNTKSLGALKDRLKEIGSNSGGNFERIPDAYEKILSQTNKVNLSLDILQVAVKGAKAGFTDIDVVAGALAQTLSVVGEENTNAAEVLDTLMKAKAVGAVEFGDVATYMPQLVAASNNLHVSMKDTAGLFAYMTAKGQSAADSAMLLQNAFTALQKKDIINGLAKNGINLFDANGMRRNLKDVFLELTTKLNSLSDKKKTKFFLDIGLNDAQAKNAFSILTSDASKFKNIMEDVNNSLGETNKQLEATGNAARTWGDVGDTFKSIGEEIGEYLIPVLDWIGKKIKTAMDMFNYFRKDIASGFKDTGTFKAQNDAMKNAADNNFEKKYGFRPNMTLSNMNKEQTTYLKNMYDGMRSAYENGSFGGSNKNKIVADEATSGKKKTKDVKLNNVNSGLDSGKGSQDSGSSSGGGSGSSGPKTLIMNVEINNTYKVADKHDVDKLKRDVTDILVDSGRDALVTLGV